MQMIRAQIWASFLLASEGVFLAMMAVRKQTITLGLAVAVTILAAVVAVWIAVPLLIIAVLLFAWGLEPKRTEEFVGRLPYGGNYIVKALAELDSMLSSWS
jgi:hypothetical protein